MRRDLKVMVNDRIIGEIRRRSWRQRCAVVDPMASAFRQPDSAAVVSDTPSAHMSTVHLPPTAASGWCHLPLRNRVPR